MGRGPGVRPVGKEAIQLDWRWKGRRYRKRIRLRPTAANLNYVRRLKATIEHEIATNTFDPSRHFGRTAWQAAHAGSTGTRLGVAIAAYLDGLVGQIEPETLAKYRHDGDTVAAWFPQATLEGLTRAEIRDKVATLNLSRKRLLNLLTPLRGALGQALDDGLVQANPLASFKVRRVSAPTEKIDPFTRDEVDRLAGTAGGEVWEFWAWAGPRSGEIIGLQWDDVAPGGRTVSIRRSVRVGREKRPKTASGARVLHLVPQAQRALQRLRRGDAGRPVFLNPTTGKRWHEDRALARAFRKACHAANVRYRGPNQLRHTFASWALTAGENPAWAAKEMGHKDLQTFFRVYAKYIREMDPKAGEKMSRLKGTRRAA